MKKVAIWDIALGLLSVFFLYLEYKKQFYSLNAFLFFFGNAIFLLTMGYNAFKKSFEKVKILSIITCIAGIIFCVALYPKIFRLIDYVGAMRARKIIPLFFAFVGFYTIHLILVARLETDE